jgi:hypothetical protein
MGIVAFCSVGEGDSYQGGATSPMAHGPERLLGMPCKLWTMPEDECGATAEGVYGASVESLILGVNYQNLRFLLP